MEILKVENLVKEYNQEANKVRALDGLSLEIDKGELVAIVGPSGSCAIISTQANLLEKSRNSVLLQKSEPNFLRAQCA